MRERILIPFLTPRRFVTLVVVPLQISGLTRIISFKSNPDRRAKVVQITTIKVVDFSAFSANERTLRTDPREKYWSGAKSKTACF